MRRVPLVDLKAQYATIREEVNCAIQRVLENASFILGSEVASFEAAFAQYIGVHGSVGVASGTAALHLALRACGVGPGDEVITTAFSFIATAEAISQCGARPVFADIVPETFNLDPHEVEKLITPRTRAVVPVHLYGHPAEMESLRRIAAEHNLYLIEDCAQAHGAEYNGQRCGAIGDVGCFSFFPAKNLGCYGDGGAVTSNNERLLSGIRALRNHGRLDKYVHQEIGFGERLDSLQAAVLSVKLQHLEEWTEARRRHAETYSRLLAGAGVTLPVANPLVRHVYHLYVLRTPHRDELLERLKVCGIEAGVHYPIPIHRQPAYLKQGYDSVCLPVTEQAAAEVLSLPMYPELQAEQLEQVARCLWDAVDK
ncbi:MAG: DegT/DnrJ/EryC1/StrS family aminotransferase [Planctomycetota bacterium]|nr:DegT/DnrJ/EryC1/StrS family aminotransferase [Planctomycetota bacterium]